MIATALSPGFSDVRFQPARDRPLGLPPSIEYSTSLPVAGSFTTSWIQLCGLVHWKSFTVPSSVTFFWLSNIANEWCAEAGAAAASETAATPARASIFLETCIELSPFAQSAFLLRARRGGSFLVAGLTSSLGPALPVIT